MNIFKNIDSMIKTDSRGGSTSREGGMLEIQIKRAYSRGNFFRGRGLIELFTVLFYVELYFILHSV